MSFRSPLGTARGLGSAKSGTEHWMIQRLTSIAMLPLTLWFAWSLVCMAGADYTAFTAWLAEPVTAVLMSAFCIMAFHHAQLGLQVVIEDYVGGGMRVATVAAVKLLAGLGAVSCVVSVVMIAVGHSA